MGILKQVVCYKNNRRLFYSESPDSRQKIYKSDDSNKNPEYHQDLGLKDRNLLILKTTITY